MRFDLVAHANLQGKKIQTCDVQNTLALNRNISISADKEMFSAETMFTESLANKAEVERTAALYINRNQRGQEKLQKSYTFKNSSLVSKPRFVRQHSAGDKMQWKNSVDTKSTGLYLYNLSCSSIKGQTHILCHTRIRRYCHYLIHVKV